MKKLIIGTMSLFVLVLLISGCINSSNDYITNNSSYEDSAGNTHFEGSFTNNGTSEAKCIAIVVVLSDNHDKNMGTNFTVLNNINAGTTKRFDVKFDGINKNQFNNYETSILYSETNQGLLESLKSRFDM